MMITRCRGNVREQTYNNLIFNSYQFSKFMHTTHSRRNQLGRGATRG
jgi:hypothetical protein